jgi:hypothetical protein
MIRSVLAFVLGFLSVTCHATSADTASTLNVGRLVKPMDTYLFKTQFYEEQKTYTRDVKGTIKDTGTTLSIILQADTEVAAVTDDGEEREKNLKIRIFIVTRNGGAPMEYLHSGAIVKCTFTEDGPQFTKDKRPLPDSVAYALAQVVRGEGGTKTGRILNPPKKVKPGDSWPVNLKEFINIVGNEAMTFDRKNITGTVRFEGILPFMDTIPAATVRADITAKRVRVQGYPGFTLGPATIAMQMGVTVPVDARQPICEVSTVTAIDIPAKPSSPLATKLDYQFRISRQQDSRFER